MEDLTADDPQRIGGYRLLARLGEGGMGRVYLARTPTRHVVVKVIRQHITHDPTFRKRFAREIDLARQVAGPYTAAVIDADPHADEPWLAIEYVPALSLHEAVTHTGSLPDDTLLILTAGLAEALAAIHRVGIVHRDLKPANVLLATDAPRVIDFGIAKAVQENTLTSLTPTNGAIGTPAYMSPEQVLGQEITAASDVFSLGGLIYYAATGKPPFGPNDPAVYFRILNISPEPAPVAPPLGDLVSACLEKNPRNRPTTQQILDMVGEIDLTRDTWIPPQILELVSETHTQIFDQVATTRHLTEALSASEPGEADKSPEPGDSLTSEQSEDPETTPIDIFVSLRDTADGQGEEGDHEQAVAQLEDLVRTYGDVLGPDNHEVLRTRFLLAYWRSQGDDATASIAEFEDLLEDQSRVLGENSPDALLTRFNIAQRQGDAGRHGVAIAMLESLLENEGCAFGVDSPEEHQTREALEHWRSQSLARWNKPLSLEESNLGELIESMRGLSEGLMDSGDTSEAEAIDRMVEGLSNSEGKTSVQLIAEAAAREKEKKKDGGFWPQWDL